MEPKGYYCLFLRRKKPELNYWYVRWNLWERAASAIVSLFDAPGGVAFSYLVIIKSMTHTYVVIIKSMTHTWRKQHRHRRVCGSFGSSRGPPSQKLVFGWSSVLFLRSVFNRRNRSQICFGDPNRGGALPKPRWSSNQSASSVAGPELNPKTVLPPRKAVQPLRFYYFLLRPRSQVLSKKKRTPKK